MRLVFATAALVLIGCSASLVYPTSDPVADGSHELRLGHCGAGSPIDFDASLWDVTSNSDPDNSMQPLEGVITVAGDLATFEAGDVKITLKRALGPRAYGGCV